MSITTAHVPVHCSEWLDATVTARHDTGGKQ